MSPPATLAAERVEVTGMVQGVGYRPFVYRIAHELGLVGRVGNDSSRVFIDVAGPVDRLEEFARRLRAYWKAWERAGHDLPYVYANSNA